MGWEKYNPQLKTFVHTALCWALRQQTYAGCCSCRLMWSGREYKSLLVAKNNKKPVLAATAVIDRLRAVAGRL